MDFELLFTDQAGADLDSLEADAGLAKRLKAVRKALGLLETNCYVVRPAGAAACWVVDPGMEPEALLERLGELRLTCERIVLTHGHADHIAGTGAVKDRWPGATITASERR